MTVTVEPNTETDILTFNLDGINGIPDSITHTVAITVPFITDLSNIIANFTLSDLASADIGGTAISSGDTWDFSLLTVVMTITADDGITRQDWTINITRAPNTETDILTYSIPGQTGPATVNNGNHTVNVEVPFGTDVTALVAIFTLSPQAVGSVGPTIQVSGITPNNFSSPVTYAVQAGDSSIQNWTVSVSFAPNTETDILSL